MDITALVLFISMIFNLFDVLFLFYVLLTEQSSSPTSRKRYINPSNYYYVLIYMYDMKISKCVRFMNEYFTLIVFIA